MPVIPLPKPLVQKLRKIHKNLGDRTFFNYLQGMDNVDPRAKGDRTIPLERVLGHVRSMNVSRNFPSFRQGIVIKWSDTIPARWAIQQIRHKVRLHNSKFQPKEYEVLNPIGYAIGEHLIAMAKVDAPTITEIYGVETKKAKVAIEEMKKHNIGPKLVMKTCVEAAKRLGISPHQILYLGVKNGKVQLLPLLDYF